MQHQLFYPALTFILREMFMTSILLCFRPDVKREFLQLLLTNSYFCIKLGWVLQCYRKCKWIFSFLRE